MSNKIETANVADISMEASHPGKIDLGDGETNEKTAICFANGSSHVYVVEGDLNVFVERITELVQLLNDNPPKKSQTEIRLDFISDDALEVAFHDYVSWISPEWGSTTPREAMLWQDKQWHEAVNVVENHQHEEPRNVRASILDLAEAIQLKFDKLAPAEKLEPEPESPLRKYQVNVAKNIREYSTYEVELTEAEAEILEDDDDDSVDLFRKLDSAGRLTDIPALADLGSCDEENLSIVSMETVESSTNPGA